MEYLKQGRVSDSKVLDICQDLPRLPDADQASEMCPRPR